MEDGEKSETTQESQELVTKREKSKCHYRLVTRSKKTGRIVSVSKWSPKSKKDLENTESVSLLGNEVVTE